MNLIIETILGGLGVVKRDVRDGNLTGASYLSMDMHDLDSYITHQLVHVKGDTDDQGAYGGLREIFPLTYPKPCFWPPPTIISRVSWHAWYTSWHACML